MPLVRIVLVIIKFFGSVGPADVAPSGGAQGVVVRAVGGECRASPFGVGIFQKRPEAVTVEGMAGSVDAAEVDKGGEEVEEGDAGVGLASGFRDSGDVDDERHVGGVIPEAPFLKVVALADAPTVVGEENDDRVVAVGTGIESVEDFADLGIDEGAGSEVALENVAVVPAFCDLFIVSAFHVLEAGDGDLSSHPGHVVEIVRVERWEGELLSVKLVPEFFGRSEGCVRAVEADHEKEGILVFLGEALGSPLGDFWI